MVRYTHARRLLYNKSDGVLRIVAKGVDRKVLNSGGDRGYKIFIYILLLLLLLLKEVGNARLGESD